jgi:hypothetical protein
MDNLRAVVFADAEGKAIDHLRFSVRDDNNPFSSGKTGFYAGGKIVLDGADYQVSCSVVKIVRKPK